MQMFADGEAIETRLSAPCGQDEANQSVVEASFNVAEPIQDMFNLGRMLAAPTRLHFAEIVAISAAFGQCRATRCPSVAQRGPNLAQCWPKLAEACQFDPKVAWGRRRAKLVRSQSEMGESWTSVDAPLLFIVVFCFCVCV